MSVSSDTVVKRMLMRRIHAMHYDINSGTWQMRSLNGPTCDDVSEGVAAGNLRCAMEDGRWSARSHSRELHLWDEHRCGHAIYKANHTSTLMYVHKRMK